MKTMHIAIIIVILAASSIIVSQNVFAQQTAKEILQERDDAKKTGLGYNGTTLIVTQEINKTEYKAGEKFSVIPHLVNAGRNVATITHGEPLFEIKVLDQNGNTSFIWPDAIATIGIDESLEPGMSTTGRWVSGYGGFPEIVLDKPGNYTVYSIASINSEGIPAHMESIWSNPLEITILPKDHTENETKSNENWSAIGKPFLMSNPLQQLKSGIAAKDVKCNEGFQIVIKTKDGSPACMSPQTAQKLVKRGWGSLIETTNKITSTNVCGQFYAAPGNLHQSNTVPVLLMNSNSTACARLTFTIISNYKDCNGQTCQNIISLDSTLHIGNLHYEKHDNMFSVSSGKDYTNSFNISTMPHTIDLDNYPIGANFTITYVIKPLPNATGFYDQSIPKLACERYPLVVGYPAYQVNASNFSYIDALNPPCVSGAYTLARVEISGMDYKQVTLGS